ncbi:MAG: F0F1 ATP synthase subunit alpha, partial [Dehalococcoidia bacterium]|nr:F0F1 ATP synthase subunit alpha [Dehalococcoidia bacterium]
QLDRGQRTTEILKQPQYTPMPLEKEVTILYAVTNGYLDDVPLERIAAFELGFHRFMENSHPEIGQRIAAQKELKPETEEALKSAILEFKRSATY